MRDTTSGPTQDLRFPVDRVYIYIYIFETCPLRPIIRAKACRGQGTRKCRDKFDNPREQSGINPFPPFVGERGGGYVWWLKRVTP